MAETLLGDHVLLQCDECQRRWKCDAPQWASTSYHACPQCRHIVADAATAVERAGERVVIDRGAYWLASPQRFDIVAFQAPSGGATLSDPALAVKRVVALPGETWELRRGDLFINGQRIRKTYDQFRQLALLAAEETSSSSSRISRWVPSIDTPTALSFRPPRTHAAAQTVASTATDYDAYNPAIARGLNEVVDLAAEVTLDRQPDLLHLQVHDGYERYTLAISFAEGTARLPLGGKEVDGTFSNRAQPGTIVAWGTCDRQIWLSIDNHVVLNHALPERSDAPAPDATPLAMVPRGGVAFRATSLRVYRDVYYLDPPGLSGDWSPSQPLGELEYALLGDNPPLSIDSRHWERAIQRQEIVGRVRRR